jgi:hypothetical protein
MKKATPEWKELLEISFLTDDMKEKYLNWKVVEMFKVVKHNMNCLFKAQFIL